MPRANPVRMISTPRSPSLPMVVALQYQVERMAGAESVTKFTWRTQITNTTDIRANTRRSIAVG